MRRQLNGKKLRKLRVFELRENIQEIKYIHIEKIQECGKDPNLMDNLIEKCKDFQNILKFGTMQKRAESSN